MFEDRSRNSLEETPASERNPLVLELRQVVATPGDLVALKGVGELGLTYLQRYRYGHWGEMDREDWAMNQRRSA